MIDDRKPGSLDRLNAENLAQVVKRLGVEDQLSCRSANKLFREAADDVIVLRENAAKYRCPNIACKNELRAAFRKHFATDRNMALGRPTSMSMRLSWPEHPWRIVDNIAWRTGDSGPIIRTAERRTYRPGTYAPNHSFVLGKLDEAGRDYRYETMASSPSLQRHFPDDADSPDGRMKVLGSNENIGPMRPGQRPESFRLIAQDTGQELAIWHRVHRFHTNLPLVHQDSWRNVTCVTCFDHPTCVAWHPNSQRVAVGFSNGSVSLTDAPTGRQTGWLNARFDEARDDNDVFERTKELLLSGSYPPPRVVSLAWRPTGGQLAVGLIGEAFRLYDVSGQPKALARILPVLDSNPVAIRLAWDPSGAKLAVALSDSRFCTYDFSPRENLVGETHATHALP